MCFLGSTPLWACQRQRTRRPDCTHSPAQALGPTPPSRARHRAPGNTSTAVKRDAYLVSLGGCCYGNQCLGGFHGNRPQLLPAGAPKAPAAARNYRGKAVGESAGFRSHPRNQSQRPFKQVMETEGNSARGGVPSPCETHPGPPPRRGFGLHRASEFFFPPSQK